MKENSPFGRRDDREFKENAVALVRGGCTVSQMARDLGVTIASSARHRGCSSRAPVGKR